MIADMQQMADCDLKDSVTGKVVKIIKNAGGGDKDWKFQVVALEDATGQIEAKIWNHSDVVAGQTYMFSPSDRGAGLALSTNEHGGRQTRQIIVRDSASMVAVNETPAAQTTQQQQTTAQTYQAPQQPTSVPTADQTVKDVADLVIRCQEALHKYVVPQVEERTGYHMTDKEKENAYHSLFLTAKERGALS